MLQLLALVVLKKEWGLRRRSTRKPAASSPRTYHRNSQGRTEKDKAHRRVVSY